MNDLGWIDLAFRSARPRVMGALNRYFGDLDLAEEAFQEACLAALRKWPGQSPPHDPPAWLILVGRNAAIDTVRRRSKQEPLPPEDDLATPEDTESSLAQRLNDAHYRDDILRLLFICCHPDLPATQQIALALRIVSGLTVKEIARAFLVGEAAMEQRITRAKARVSDANVPFETPDQPERARRLTGVAAVIYLMFNEGYSSAGGDALIRAHLCDEAIRLGRLLLRLFPDQPELMGLVALMLLQHARAAARLDGDGAVVLLEDQDRGLWNRSLIDEGRALLDKAIRHRSRGPYQIQAAIAALHSGAKRYGDTDWHQNRPSLRRSRRHRAFPGGPAESRGRRVQGARPRRRAGDDRTARERALQLLLLLRGPGLAAGTTRAQGGGARRLRPRHRARAHAGRGSPHPHAPRSIGQPVSEQRAGPYSAKTRSPTPETRRRAVVTSPGKSASGLRAPRASVCAELTMSPLR